MNGAPRPTTIRQRVALLVGFATVTVIVLFAWLAISGLRSFSQSLRAERRAVAESLAANIDHQVQQTLASLSTAALMAADAPPEGLYPSLRAVYLRSLILDGLVVLEATKQVQWQEFRRDPIPAEVLAKLAAIDEAFASGKQKTVRLADPASTLLLVPLREWQGKIPRMLIAVVSPASPAWDTILRQEFLGTATATLTQMGDESPLPPDSSLTVARLEHLPWQILLRHPDSDSLAWLGDKLWPLFLLAPLMLFLALGFAWGVARSVTEPLAALDQAAARIAAGNLETTVPSQGVDEVGRLSHSLEQMRQALKRSLDDLTRSRDALDERVKERTRELRELLTKLVSAQEDERKRLARELHDETCQDLVALGMKMDAALAASTPAAAREGLQEARALAGQALAEIHRLIYDLRPSVLDDLGLFPSVRWLAEHHLKPAGIAFRCEVTEPERRLAPDQETVLFRAVQEALQNVARHSGAETVLVQIEPRGPSLQIEIEDDGHGFDPESVAQPGPTGRGLGLLGMRERLSLLGGSAQILSSPGAGTRVVLTVPFRPEVNHG
jgi:signal transduction histidine kinase